MADDCPIARNRGKIGAMSRPQNLLPLFRSLHTIKGVGDKLAALLTRYFGAPDGQEAIVLDVLMHMPSGVVDRRRQVGIAEAYLNQIVTLRLDWRPRA